MTDNFHLLEANFNQDGGCSALKKVNYSQLSGTHVNEISNNNLENVDPWLEFSRFLSLDDDFEEIIKQNDKKILILENKKLL
jgi:hypothetical protein